MTEVLEHFQAFSMLVLLRLAGFMAFVRLFTPFSAISRSVLLQTAVALAMTLPLLPDIVVGLPRSGRLTALDFVLQGLSAVLAGASFAVLCSVPIRIAAAVGEVVDNARGLQANGPLNPVTRDEATPLSSAVTATLSLVVFAFGWHLDIIEDLYAVVPAPDLRALADSVRDTAPLWVQSVDVLGTFLTRLLPLLGLLVAVDLAITLSTKNLKSGDMGGAENTIKILIVAVWAVFLLQVLLSPHEMGRMRAAFHELVSPLDRVERVVPH